MNTAIHDAHNLSWKLAFAGAGWAGTELLDTYERERRPVDERNTRRSMVATEQYPKDQVEVDALGWDLGTHYEQGALVDDGSGPAAAGRWRPSARPGARAPHVWLEQDGRRVSTLDLLGPHLTVLTGRDGTAWRSAAREIRSFDGAPMRVCSINGRNGSAGTTPVRDPQGSFEPLYGLDVDGAVLVRPDGHIAWRVASARSVDAVAELRRGVRAALGHTVQVAVGPAA